MRRNHFFKDLFSRINTESINLTIPFSKDEIQFTIGNGFGSYPNSIPKRFKMEYKILGNYPPPCHGDQLLVPWRRLQVPLRWALSAMESWRRLPVPWRWLPVP